MNIAVIRNDWVGQAADGRFPLYECLGGTDESSVFRTEVREPEQRKAAIKLIPFDAENAPSQIDLWAAATAFYHPHLMRIFATGRCQIDGFDLLYVVTEYAEESLARVIPERTLTPDETREMLVPVVDVLSYLHERGFVYGDLKPSNIMVVDDQLKLPVDNVRRAGSFGKPTGGQRVYDAPETASGAMSPTADIWSLGVTIVEALSQLPPMWDRSTSRDPVVPAAVPQPFADIARGCLRYGSADRLRLRDIKARLDQPESRAEADAIAEKPAPIRSAAPVEKSSAALLSKRRMAVIAAGAVVLLAVFLAVMLHRPQPLSTPEPQAVAPVVQATPGPPPPALPPPPQRAAIVSAKGEVIERVMPDVLASARRSITGKVEVRVRVVVDETGAISRAEFESAGSSRYFAGKALEAARRWRFKPAILNGKPVSSYWTLRFEFRRSGPSATAVQVTP